MSMNHEKDIWDNNDSGLWFAPQDIDRGLGAWFDELHLSYRKRLGVSRECFNKENDVKERLREVSNYIEEQLKGFLFEPNEPTVDDDNTLWVDIYVRPPVPVQMIHCNIKISKEQPKSGIQFIKYGEKDELR